MSWTVNLCVMSFRVIAWLQTGEVPQHCIGRIACIGLANPMGTKAAAQSYSWQNCLEKVTAPEPD